MNFYTVILEFGGGTYVSQVWGIDETSALNLWITSPSDELLSGVGYSGRRQIWVSGIESEIQDDISRLTPLEGLNSVWFFHFVQNGTSGWVHIVKTTGQ